LQGGRQTVRRRFERGVTDRRRTQRIQVGGEMPVPAIRRDDGHARRGGTKHFVRGRRRRGTDRRERNLRYRRGLQTQRREDRFVEAALALQQLVDVAQIFPGLRALDDAVIVGARELHHPRNAQQPKRLFVRAGEARRIADRAGGDDRSLPRHQTRHRCDGADAAGIGQRKGSALQIVGAELVLAGAHDELFVLGAKAREIE
jgi:hypothetical protein